MKNVKVIFSLILIGLVVIFSIQNADVVSVHFLTWNFTISLALLVFIVLAFGLLSGWLMQSLFLRKERKRATKKAEEKVKQTEPEKTDVNKSADEKPKREQ